MTMGATPGEASEKFRALLQLALSCVSRSVVSSALFPTETAFTVSDLIPSANGPLALGLRLQHLLVHDSTRHRSERWSVRLVRYSYQLDRADGRELLAYHWHPIGLNHERRPHLHLGAGMGFAASEWQKAHLPAQPRRHLGTLSRRARGARPPTGLARRLRPLSGGVCRLSTNRPDLSTL